MSIAFIITCICISVNVFMTIFCMNKIENKGWRHLSAGVNFAALVFNFTLLVAHEGWSGLMIAILMIGLGMAVYYKTRGV